MAGKKNVGRVVRLGSGGTRKINAGRSAANVEARGQLVSPAARAKASAPTNGRPTNAGIGDIFNSLTGVGNVLKGRKK